jgi:integrase
MKTTDVRFWDVRKLQRRTGTFEVRWVVAGKERSRTRRTKALADAFLADLRAAARRGELFDTESGLPDSMQPAATGLTWLRFAQDYVDTKWPHVAAKSRDAMTDALATISAALIGKDAPPIEPLLIRAALRQHLLPPSTRDNEAPTELREAIGWLERHSLPLTELSRPAQLRRALDAIARTLEGRPAAATIIRRKRAVLNNALQYAVETEQLSANNLGRIGWRLPKISDTVDRRVVINPTQARELLITVTYVGPLDRGRHLRGFFACLYYAGLRPAEAQGLRVQDCELPKTGWGYLNLAKSRPESNRRWTDTGDAHEERGLKHRASAEVRRIPIPPELVAILREHLAEFGTAPDGRVFHTRRGGVIGSNYADIWSQARHYALTPTQVLSPLAARPYDLRHAAVSLWLNSGVPAPDVADRAGHGVDVLLRVYASCIDGTEDAANRRIQAGLGHRTDAAPGQIEPPGRSLEL